MNKCFIKCLFASLLWAVPISVSSHTPDSVKLAIHMRHMDRYQRRWQALIPTQLAFHYAGNMGVASAGVGWSYGKNHQWETELLLGIIPKYSSSRAKAMMTIKENYIPWSLKIRKSPISIEPLTASYYVTTVFDHSFWARQPERYPKGYYWFPTRLRHNIAVGQRVTRTFANNGKPNTDGFTLLWELSTTELDIIYKIHNKTVKMKDILHLSVGLKLEL